MFLDDIKFTNDIIELLKLLLDNERKNKTHKTVVDHELVDIKLEGIFLGLLNRAKDDLDSELADRCYLNSLEENNPYIKNKIKLNNITNIKNDNFNFKLKCAYQYLIDKKITVYNPMLLFFDVEKHDHRNINHYLSLANGMVFYNYDKRKTIDNITIGSYKDIENTLNIVVEDFTVQKDKLLDSHKKVLNELETDPDCNTTKKLEGATGLSNETVRTKLRDLELKGYIKISKEPEYQFDPSEYEFIKSYKEDLKENSTLPMLPSFIGCKEKKSFIS